MRNLFKFKRMSFRLLSKLWYLIFFALGFGAGLIVNNANIIDKIKEIMRQVVY